MKSILLKRQSTIVDAFIGLFIFLIMMLVSFTGHSQNVGINNPTPHAKSILDLTASDKGLLAPRMTEAQRVAMFPSADATAKGMLVYQTDNTQGFYYYDGAAWQYLANGTSGWSLTGNAGTSPATNFLGTTDFQDLTIKTNNNSVITVTKNGRTRIGTPAPLPTLGSERLEIADSNGFKSDLVFVTGGAGPAQKGYPQIVFDKSRNTNFAPTAVQNGDWTGVIVGRGYDGTSYVNNSAMIFGIDGPVSSGVVPGNIQFQTSAGGNAEKVRISNLGNVGIGNTNPQYPLSFASTIGDKICLWGAAGNHYGFGIAGNLLQIHSANSTDDIAFGYGSSAAFTENMRIAGNGNVGIGTSTPGAKLQVEANAPGTIATYIRNQSNSGYSGIIFGSMVSNAAHIGYGNPSSPNWANQAYAGSIASIPFVLTTADQERMRIDATGNVGIGTQTPSAKLEVNGTMKLTDGSQGLGKVLTSDANGLASWQTASASNLGGWGVTGNAGTTPATNFMGTTDNQDVVFKSNNSEVMRLKPNNKINISTNNTPPLYGYAKMAISDENGFNSDIEIRVAAGSYGQLVLDQTGGTLASPAPSANGQLSGVLVGRSYDGTSLINTSAVVMAVDSAVAPGVMRGNIQFHTTGGTQNEKMRITRNGDIGIGTTNPWLRLDVEGNAAGVPVSYVRNQNAAGFSGTIFGSSAGGSMAHIGYGNPSAGIWTNLAYAGSIANIPFVLTTGDQERVRIDAAGNVGIGNNTPYFPLSFNSVIGDKISFWGGSGNHYGIGIQSNLMQIHSANTVDDIAFGYGTSSAFSENMRITGTGNVGIGTTAPYAKLQVISNSGAAPTFVIQNQLATGFAGMWLQGTGNTNMAHFGYANPSAPVWANQAYAGSIASIPFVLTTADQERVRIDATGNVGIGTTTPSAKLEVNGNIKITDGSQGLGKILTSDAAGLASWQMLTASSISGWGLFGNTGTNPLTNYIGTGDAADLSVRTNNTERIKVKSTGEVGIGTSTPTAALEVNGYTKLGSNAPAIKVVEFTGTTASTQGGSVNVAHGLNSGKILSVDVLVEYVAGSFVHHSYTWTSGFDFNFYINSANVVVANSFSNSNSILSKPFKMLITYMQ